MQKPTTRTVILAAILMAGLAAVVFQSKIRNVDQTGMPVSSDLRGQLVSIGLKQSKEVVRVTFTGTTVFETLLQNKIYVVNVPDDPEVPALTLDQAIKLTSDNAQPVNYFGYKYTSADGAIEAENWDAQYFLSRFPGRFFASAQARAEDAQYGNIISRFEQNQGITMESTGASGVGLVRNSRYIIIVNESESVTFYIRQPEADLSLNSADFNSANIMRGEDAVLSVTVKNFSEFFSANNPVVHMPVPSNGLTFESAAGADCTVESGQMACRLADIPAQGTASFAVTFNVSGGCTSDQAVTAELSVSSDTPDPNAGDTGNNQRQASFTAVCPRVDLSVVAGPGTSPAIWGQTIRYLVTARNDGVDTAWYPQIHFTLPSRVTFESAAGANCYAVPGQTPQQVQCNFGDGGNVVAGSEVSFTVDFRMDDVSSCNLPDTTMSLPVSVETLYGVDTDVDNNHADTSLNVSCGISDLAMTVGSNGTNVTRGTPVTFSFRVTNNGPSSAMVQVLIPASGLEVDSLLSADATCEMDGAGNIRCDFPGGSRIERNAYRSFQLTMRAPGMSPCSGTEAFTVTAEALSDTTDPELGNNTASRSLNASCPADLVVSADPATHYRGESFDFSFDVTNTGADVANNTHLRFAIPEGLEFGTPSMCIYEAETRTFDCGLGNLQAGSPTVTKTFTLRAPLITPCESSQDFTLTADVTTTSAETETSNNTVSSTVTATCPPSADLSSTVTANPMSAVQGSQVTLSVNVHNAGPSTATNAHANIDVTGMTNLQVQTTGINCSTTVSGLTCTLGNMASGADQPVVVLATLTEYSPCTSGSTSSRYVNIYPGSDTADGNTANDHSGVIVTATCPPLYPDLAVTASASPSSVERGNNTVLTFHVTNSGQGNAVNARLNYPVQSSVTYVSYSAPNATCGYSNNTLTCTFGTLAPGASRDVNVTVLVPTISPCTSSQNITASVDVATDSTDSNAGNNYATTTVTATCPVLQFSPAPYVDASGLPMNPNYSVQLTPPSSVTQTSPSQSFSIPGTINAFPLPGTQYPISFAFYLTYSPELTIGWPQPSGAISIGCSQPFNNIPNIRLCVGTVFEAGPQSISIPFTLPQMCIANTYQMILIPDANPAHMQDLSRPVTCQ